MLLAFSLGMVSCGKATDNDMPKETLTDSLTSALQAEYELLLNRASDYAMKPITVMWTVNMRWLYNI